MPTIATIVEGLDHPEGVAWDPLTQTLYAGGEAGQIYAVKDGRADVIAETGGFVLGLAVDGSGLVYACDSARRAVMLIDPTTGVVEEHSFGTAEEPMRSPNWPVFADDGTLYVTDSGTWGGDDGVIYRVDPSGATSVWTRAAAAFPNGACLTSDGDALLVVESTRPGVVSVPLAADGTAGAPTVVTTLPGTVPDGIALDADGRLYIACYRPDRVYVLDGDALEILADDPAGTALAAPTNVAFFGDGLARLGCANLGRWHLAELTPRGPGLALPRPQARDR